MALIINKTPHPVNILGKDNKVIAVFPKGDPIRLEQETVPAGFINGIPLTSTVYGEGNLPKYCWDIYYIVSQLVKSAYPDREDLLVPAEVVRDNAGNIIGCKSLGV